MHMFVSAYDYCTYTDLFRSHCLLYVSGCTKEIICWLFDVFSATLLFCVVPVWGYGQNGAHSPLCLMGRMGVIIFGDVVE